MVKHNHYINNDKLEILVSNWVNDFQICECLDRKRPKIPDNIGRAILKIINGLASRYNFHQYTYREEMVGDAIVHVCTYLSSFNRLKGTAFNFISFAASNSFSARIKHEQRQSYYKNKNLQMIADTTGVTDVNGKFIDPGLARMINDSSSSDFAEKVAKYEEKYKTDRQKGIKPKKRLTRGLFALALEVQSECSLDEEESKDGKRIFPEEREDNGNTY